MKALLESNIPGIMVTGSSTPTTSGAFEVENIETSRKYHSKLNGDGYLDTGLLDKFTLPRPTGSSDPSDAT